MNPPLPPKRYLSSLLSDVPRCAWDVATGPLGGDRHGGGGGSRPRGLPRPSPPPGPPLRVDGRSKVQPDRLGATTTMMGHMQKSDNRNLTGILSD